MIDASNLTEEQLRTFMQTFILGTKQDIVETAKSLPFIDYLEVTVNLIMAINLESLAPILHTETMEKLAALQKTALALTIMGGGDNNPTIDPTYLMQ